MSGNPETVQPSMKYKTPIAQLKRLQGRTVLDTPLSNLFFASMRSPTILKICLTREGIKIFLS
jgi:hypothetical protein